LRAKTTLLVLLALCLLTSATVACLPQAVAQESGESESIARLQVQVADFEGNPFDGATVEARNTTGALLDSATTNATGWATLEVPNGTTCDIEVSWMDAIVGALESVQVAGNMTLGPIRCSVCGLHVRAVRQDGTPLVNVKVEITGSYTNRQGNTTTFTRALTTDLSGTCTLKHALMNCSYVIKAYRHGLPKPFDIARLRALNGTTTVNLTCPMLVLKVSVVDGQMRPVEGAKVEAWDWGTGELVGTARVDSRGLAILTVPFGKCKLRALRETRLLAETEASVQENNTWCSLVCGALNLSLRVLVQDALGRPVKGVHVRLVDEKRNTLAEVTTGRDGTAEFNGLTEGTYKVIVLHGDKELAMRTLSLAGPTRLDIRLADQVVLFGTLASVPALMLSIAVAIVVSLILVAALIWPKLAGEKAL